MRRTLKFLHTAGSLGFAGGLVAFMLLAANGPQAAATPEFLAVRTLADQLSSWLILPSVALVALSGVLAMAFHFPFHNAGWVWLKLLTGLLVLEATLASVDAPAQATLAAAELAVAGDIGAVELLARVDDKWGAWWALLALAVLNVYLGVFRPRFMRRRPAES